MRRFSYVCSRNGIPVVRDGSGEEMPSCNGRVLQGFDAAILSRLCIDTIFLDLPFAEKPELLPVIRYRLQAHYPGNLHEVEISWTAFRLPTGMRVVAFLLRKDFLAELRSLTGWLPVIPGLPLVFPTSNPGKIRPDAQPSFHALVYPDCIEYVKCSGGKPEESEVVPIDTREPGSLPADIFSGCLGSLKTSAAGTGSFALHAPLYSMPSLIKALESTPAETGTTPSPFEASLPGLLRTTGGFYSTRKHAFHIARASRIAVLALALCALAAWSGFREIREKERKLEALKIEYLSMEKAFRERAVLDEGLKKRMRILESLESRQPTDVYRLLSLISRTLGREVTVRSFLVHGEKFELEGVAGSPFSLISRFDTEGAVFSSVEISRITPLPDGSGNQFFLSGLYHGR